MFKSVDDFLAHYGVKGMKWGVTKRYTNYRDTVHQSSPGAIKTQVVAKTGERISVVKEKPHAILLATMKLTGRKPADTVSSMSIVDSSGKKVGSFQVWREGKETVRGEWLEVKKSAQGNGYSKAAIEGLIKAAKNDPELKHVRLQVPSDATPAKHIYGSLGFRKDRDLGEAAGFGNLEDWVLDLKK